MNQQTMVFLSIGFNQEDLKYENLITGEDADHWIEAKDKEISSLNPMNLFP